MQTPVIKGSYDLEMELHPINPGYPFEFSDLCGNFIKLTEILNHHPEQAPGVPIRKGGGVQLGDVDVFCPKDCCYGTQHAWFIFADD